MKNTKLIDVLPTVFGVILLLSFGAAFGHVGEPEPLIKLWFPSGVLTFIFAVVSLITAKRRHVDRSTNILNFCWLALIIVLLGVIVYGLSTWTSI